MPCTVSLFDVRNSCSDKVSFEAAQHFCDILVKMGYAEYHRPGERFTALYEKIASPSDEVVSKWTDPDEDRSAQDIIKDLKELDKKYKEQTQAIIEKLEMENIRLKGVITGLEVALDKAIVKLLER